ncbi:MAG TPA: hypothetical protein GYA07_03570 [Verrucomicrobia bacterium]|nr:hypothetical protein [Verrucomicrobiota bacterium]HOP96638.1 immunoglobulin domain-containing protein [Verrucomicrobiota bacterium]
MKRIRWIVALAAALCVGTSLQAQSPIAWWQAENNYLDSVGNSHGIAPMVQFSPGYSGQAFEFISGAAVQVPRNISLEPATVTVQAWARATAPGTFRYILVKGTVSPFNASYALYTGSDGLVHFLVVTDAGLLLSGAPEANLWDGNWHQLTGVFDGTNALLYVDGVLCTAGAPEPRTEPTSVIYTNPGDLIMGAYIDPNTPLPFATGSLDEVRIFNHALTAEEVLDTYTNPSSPALTAGLISYWKADGDTQDSVGGNHGEIVRDTLVNFEFGSGKIGRGFTANGGRLAVQNSPAPSVFTVQAWVQSCNLPNSRYIVSRYPGYCLATGGFVPAHAGIGGLVFFTDVAAENTTQVAPAGKVWDGGWHQITGVFDGSFNRLYIDGVEFSAVPASYNPPGGDLTFGDYQPAGGLPWFGLLDEIKVYDVALSPSEVLSAFVSGLGGTLIGWWRAEGDALDTVGSHHGTFAPGIYSGGKFTGRAFDTSSGVVVVPGAASLEPAHLTVSAMVRADVPQTNKYLLNKAYNGSGGSYALRTGADGELIFSVMTAGGIVDSPSAAAMLVWDGKYHGIAGSYDGEKVRLYVDGVEAGAGTPASGAIQYNGGDLYFGDSQSPAGSANFTGVIDEIRIYSEARTVKDIRADIPDGVAIVQQPQSRNVTIGTNLTLTVNARAYVQPISYQWMHNGVDIPGATNTTLSITNLQPEDLGEYAVRVNAGTGTGIVEDVDGRFPGGKAFRLTNYNIGVQERSDGELDLQEFTYLMWVRGPDPGTFKYLFSRARRAPGPDMAAVALYTGSPAGIQGIITLVQTNNAGDLVTTNQYITPFTESSTNVWDGNWHQVGLTWDGSVLVTYVDGAVSAVLDPSPGFQPGVISYSDGSGYQDGLLVIGGLVIDDLNIVKYVNDLDDFKIFNRALSADEIAANFVNPASNPAGLIGIWSGDDGTVADSFGSNNGFALPPIGTVGSEISDTAVLTAVAPARITEVAVEDGFFRGRVEGPGGQSYAVEVTPTLANPSWSSLVTNTVPYYFTNAVGTGANFYRAVAK